VEIIVLLTLFFSVDKFRRKKIQNEELYERMKHFEKYSLPMKACKKCSRLYLKNELRIE